MGTPNKYPGIVGPCQVQFVAKFRRRVAWLVATNPPVVCSPQDGGLVRELIPKCTKHWRTHERACMIIFIHFPNINYQINEQTVGGCAVPIWRHARPRSNLNVYLKVEIIIVQVPCSSFLEVYCTSVISGALTKLKLHVDMHGNKLNHCRVWLLSSFQKPYLTHTYSIYFFRLDAWLTCVFVWP